MISNINLNFDSLGWAVRANPRGFDDPSFFTVADRFLKLADKYNFKYTIFVIGKDLVNPSVAKMVKEWQDLGHEIGNHSYNHRNDFGSLSYDDTYNEVMLSHDVIRSACKRDPKGFIAPGWATSKHLINILIKGQYDYDTSLFPSWFMYLAALKFFWNYKYDIRRFDLIKGMDAKSNLFEHTDPFYMNGTSVFQENRKILILPLPVTRPFKIPCWHTMKFMLPFAISEWSMDRLFQSKYFYYLIHPTDLMDLNDVPKEYREKARVLERIKIPLRVKMNMMERALLKIKRHSSRMVTLSEMSDDIKQNRLVENQ